MRQTIDPLDRWSAASTTIATPSRRTPAVIGSTLAAIGLLLSVHMDSTIGAVASSYLKSWSGSTTPFFYIATLLAIILWLGMRTARNLNSESSNN